MTLHHDESVSRSEDPEVQKGELEFVVQVAEGTRNGRISWYGDSGSGPLVARWHQDLRLHLYYEKVELVLEAFDPDSLQPACKAHGSSISLIGRELRALRAEVVNYIRRQAKSGKA